MPRITEWTSTELLAYWQPPYPDLDIDAIVHEDRVYPQLPQSVRDALRQNRALIRSLTQEARP